MKSARVLVWRLAWFYAGWWWFFPSVMLVYAAVRGDARLLAANVLAAIPWWFIGSRLETSAVSYFLILLIERRQSRRERVRL